MNLETIIDDLLDELEVLRFGPPVTHVYNPLDYARASYAQYCQRYAKLSAEIALIGMNPGPWGMTQTGIPFGEINAVKDWLGISAPIGKPDKMHPKRPVMGYECTRSEISGKRLWGWAQKAFKTPERFFARFFIANYCPLQFIESSGRNRTPNQLRASERKPLFEACDRALRRTIEYLNPLYVIGVGRFVQERAKIVLSDLELTVASITHPSPANPKANKDWDARVTKELTNLGINF